MRHCGTFEMIFNRALGVGDVLTTVELFSLSLGNRTW